MNENDLIAEYVKEKCPEILDTTGFAAFKAKKIMIETAKPYVEKLNEMISELYDKLKPQIDIATEILKEKMEHDGCAGCKYEHEGEDGFHCMYCKRNYEDEYTFKELKEGADNG